MTKKWIIFEISNVYLWPESAGNWPICYRKVRLGPKSSQNFIYRKRTKIDDFISKKHTPKKALLGGGGISCTYNLRVSWAGKSGPPGNISADFRPISATNLQLKFWNYGIFEHFLENLETFFFQNFVLVQNHPKINWNGFLVLLWVLKMIPI